MTLSEFFEEVYPLLLNHTLNKVERELDCGKITAYWVNTIIRIDIKPDIEYHY